MLHRILPLFFRLTAAYSRFIFAGLPGYPEHSPAAYYQISTSIPFLPEYSSKLNTEVLNVYTARFRKKLTIRQNLLNCSAIFSFKKLIIMYNNEMDFCPAFFWIFFLNIHDRQPVLTKK